MNTYASRTARLRRALLSLTFLLVPEIANAQLGILPELFREQHIVQPGIETPHTKWAKPYAGGPIRVLYLIEGSQFGPRARIVELKQRFDLETEGVYSTIRYAAGWFKQEPLVLGEHMGVARMMDLLSREFDCFVLGERFLGGLLPEEGRYKILRQVSEGAGLVVIPGGAEGPVDLLPDRFQRSSGDGWLSDLDFVETYRLGDGRGAIIRGGRYEIPEVIGTSLQSDHRFEALGRVMLWAAGREPTLKLSIDSPKTLERSKLGESRLRLVWSGRPTGGGALARLWVRRSDGVRWPIASDVVVASPGGVDLTLPQLPASYYIVEAQVKSDAGVESWATRSLEVTAPQGLHIKIDGEAARERGEPITGAIDLHGIEDASRSKVRVEIVDAYGRVFHRQELAVSSAGKSSIRYSLPTYGASRRTPSLVRVAAELLVDGESVAQAPLGKKGSVFSGRYVHLTTRHHGEFNFLTWGKTYNQNLRPYNAQKLADIGITAQLERYPDWESTAGGLSWVPYPTGIRYKLENGLLQPASWNNEEAVNEWVKKTVGSTGSTHLQGGLVYNLGDENDLFGADYSEEDLVAYRRFLAVQYPSIEELNESWSTSFADFDEVGLSDPKDLTESGSLRAKNFPRWWSRRAFMRHNYGMLVRRFQKKFEERDPQAKAGFEGAGWMDDDIDLLVRQVKFWAPYSHLVMQVISSITPPDFVVGQWSTNWDVALHGGRMFGWFRMDNAGARHASLLGPDMEVRPMHRYAVETRQIWLHGLGTSLIHWQRDSFGVAMLYSFPSSNATQVLAGPSYRALGRFGEEADLNHACWHRNLRASGVQFRYITAGMIERGEWAGAGDKLLILGQSEALSDKQVSVIKAFVEGGGTVVADVRPGLFNEHLKPQGSGLLDGLFGVRHTANASATARTAEIDWHLNGGEIHGTVDLLVNPAIELAGGSPQGWAGDTPIVVVNEYGRGRAILLNFAANSFPRLNENGAPQPPRELFEAVLNVAGVSRDFVVTNEEGEVQHDVEVVRWVEGDYEVVALYRPKPTDYEDLRSVPPRESISCDLGRARVVTDIRTGRSRPASRVYFTTLRAGEPAFLLISATEPSAPRVELPSSVTRGQLLEMKVQLPNDATRCVRIEATDPAGKPARWFRRVEKVQSQSVTFQLGVAFNEQPGVWGFKVTDTVTGKSASRTIQVE